MDTAHIFFITAVGIFTVLASLWDLRTRRLPNWLTVSGLIAAFIYHGLVGGGKGLLSSAAGFAVGFGILLVLWLIGGSGAGDVKLMGALGAWLGVKGTVSVFLASTLIVVLAGMAVLFVQVIRRGIGYVHRRYWRMPDPSSRHPGSKGQDAIRQRQHRRLLPYALPVSLGTWVVLAWQVWQS